MGKQTKAEKQAYVAKCKELFGVELENPDVCDAYMIVRAVLRLFFASPENLRTRELAYGYLRRVYDR